MKSNIQIALLLVILTMGSCSDSNKKKDLGDPIPNEAIIENKEEYHIKSLSFSDFQSQYLQHNNDTTYVINFWATWCAPCVKELPQFEALTADLKNEKLKVILVSLDMPNKLDESLKPFLKKNNLQSEVIHLNEVDGNKWIPIIDPDWSGAIPATLVYNGDQSMFKEGSYDDEDCLQCEIKPFLVR